jgi:C-terminal processing protease CtpA/Prc
MLGKPLYVLTSARAASAAEEFASHVSLFKVGELVGETTAGAPHRNTLFPVPGGLRGEHLCGTAHSPDQQGNWEGVGVKPTVETPADQALDLAHMRAAARLAQVEGPEKADYVRLAESLRARCPRPDWRRRCTPTPAASANG